MNILAYHGNFPPFYFLLRNIFRTFAAPNIGDIGGVKN